MNCVLYARSRAYKKAKDIKSIRSQISALRQFARAHRWRVIGEFSDAGRSANDMKRPGLQDLIAFCKRSKTANAIMVQSIDGLARHLDDYVAFKKRLGRRSI